MKRWLMLLLLCLTIPLQGMAMVRGQRCPCPMTATSALAAATTEAADATVAEVDVDVTVDVDDCCNEADTAARTGQPCKAGQECHAPVLALADVETVELAFFAAHRTDASAADRAPIGRPAVVWRPPAALLIA